MQNDFVHNHLFHFVFFYHSLFLYHSIIFTGEDLFLWEYPGGSRYAEISKGPWACGSKFGKRASKICMAEGACSCTGAEISTGMRTQTKGFGP